MTKSKGVGRGQHPKAIRARKYGNQLYKIRGVCAMLKILQAEMKVEFIKNVDSIQEIFEAESKLQYEADIASMGGKK